MICELNFSVSPSPFGFRIGDLYVAGPGGFWDQGLTINMDRTWDSAGKDTQKQQLHRIVGNAVRGFIMNMFMTNI